MLQQGTIVFPAGSQPANTRQTITLTAIDDTLPEDNQLYNVVLATQVIGRIASQNSVANVTIAINDNATGVFGFDSASQSVSLIEPPGSTVSSRALRIVRAGGAVGRAVLRWAVQGLCTDLTNATCTGLAPIAADLSMALTGTVTFEDGQREATVTVTIIGDDVPEGDEPFRVVLTDFDVAVPDGLIDQAAAAAFLTIANNNNGAGEFAGYLFIFLKQILFFFIL